jgi:hypothetical protein
MSLSIINIFHKSRDDFWTVHHCVLSSDYILCLVHTTFSVNEWTSKCKVDIIHSFIHYFLSVSCTDNCIAQWIYTKQLNKYLTKWQKRVFHLLIQSLFSTWFQDSGQWTFPMSLVKNALRDHAELPISAVGTTMWLRSSSNQVCSPFIIVITCVCMYVCTEHVCSFSLWFSPLPWYNF